MQLAGNLSSNGPGGITLIGNNFVRSGSLITTGGGSFSVTNSGQITGTSINTTSIDGSYTQNGTGPVFFAGTISANNISFSSPITLLAGGSFDTSSGNGDITLSNTVDGLSSLGFAAGTGNIVLSAPLGSVTPLGDITISSAGNVTAQAITSSSISQLAGAGTSTFNGAITTSGAAGINLVGTNIVRGGTWLTNGTGGITIDNSPIGTFTSTAAGTIQSATSFNQSGTGPVTLGGSILTSNAPISFNGPITLAAATSLNSGSGAGNININGSVDGNNDLNLTAGTGNITLTGPVGVTRIGTLAIISATNVMTGNISAAAISQTSGLGTTTLGGIINTNGVAGITLSGTGFAVNGSVTTTTASTGAGMTIANTGAFSFGPSANLNIAGPFAQNGLGSVTLQGSITTGGAVTFQGPVFLANSGLAAIDTSLNNNPIQFQNSVDGPGSLTCTLGNGNLTFLSNVGSGPSVAAFTINSVGTLSTKNIIAGSITQSSGTNLSTFSGDISANGVGGINLTGTAFTFVGNATSAGPLSIDNTGALITAAGKTFSSAGAFNQSGVGAVSLAGTVQTTNQDLSFTGPITLIAPVSLNSGNGAGTVTLSSSVDGAQPLTITAGLGDINVAGNMGVNARLGDVIFVSAYDVNLATILATSFTQQSVSNQFSQIGTFNTNGAGGISLTGNQFFRQGSLVTTNGGDLIFLLRCYYMCSRKHCKY